MTDISYANAGGKSASNFGPGGVGGGGKHLPTAPDSVGVEAAAEVKTGGDRGGTQTGSSAVTRPPKSKGKVEWRTQITWMLVRSENRRTAF